MILRMMKPSWCRLTVKCDPADVVVANGISIYFCRPSCYWLETRCNWVRPSFAECPLSLLTYQKCVIADKHWWELNFSGSLASVTSWGLLRPYKLWCCNVSTLTVRLVRSFADKNSGRQPAAELNYASHMHTPAWENLLTQSTGQNTTLFSQHNGPCTRMTREW